MPSDRRGVQNGLSLIIDRAAYVMPFLKSVEVDVLMKIPPLTSLDGVVHLPKDWPGPVVSVNSPEYAAAHPSDGIKIKFMDPPTPPQA